MAVRTIVATKPTNASNNTFASYSMIFNVDSDTGPVTGVPIVSATMYMSAVGNYVSKNYFQVKNGSASGTVLATTPTLPVVDEYTSVTLPLSSLQDALLTDEFSTICLTLQATDGDKSAYIYVEAGSQLILTITYADRCGSPYNIQLSASESYNNYEVLSWSAAADGAGNAVTGYEVQRDSSADGVTWSGTWVSLGTTTNLYMSVQTPTTVGHYYRYYVRALGEVESLPSYWAQGPTLKKIEIPRCGMPGNVRLSASETSGSVLLSWTAGTGSTGNMVDYYQVQRCLSTDGTTWGTWEHQVFTTNTYTSVSAPETVGNYYKYRVRTVGTAGTAYASDWVASGTLKKVEAALVAYTDPIITAGETRVKAAHITELQTNINLVRAAFNMSAYTYATITAQYTSLAGWNDHIAELRTAIDAVSTAHETWLTLGENKPRADVLEQLRRVVEAVSKS